MIEVISCNVAATTFLNIEFKQAERNSDLSGKKIILNSSSLKDSKDLKESTETPKR